MNKEQQTAIINDLQIKEFRIADTILTLLNNGYIPNNTKYFKLQWSIILSSAIKNINIFNNEKQNKFIETYLKFSRL